MRAWIFQGNPDVFDLDTYVQPEREILWTVRQKQYASQIEIGDRVYLWRSQGSGKDESGVFASAVITERAMARAEDPVAVPLWRNGQTGTALRVAMRVEKVANKKQLLRRAWLKDEPQLKDLRVLRMAANTNFLVDDSHVARLEQLWRTTGTRWTRDDCVAALWAYEQTRGKSISKLAGSPVSDVAMLIGRPVGGVYNAIMNYRALDPRDDRKGLDAAADELETTWNEFWDGASVKSEALEREYARVKQEHQRAVPQPLVQGLNELLRAAVTVAGSLNDVRDDRDTPDERRRARFASGWTDAAEANRVYTGGTLAQLTWQNLGYRIGRQVGPASVEAMDTVYSRLAVDWAASVRDRLSLPPSIPRNTLLKAMQRIDRDGFAPHADSTTYDVREAGKAYPPIALVAFAMEDLGMGVIPPGAIRGGKGTQAFRILESAGLAIVPKYLAPTASWSELEEKAAEIQKQGAIQEAPPAGNKQPSRVAGCAVQESFVRDPAVVAWVLAAAKGNCELCGKPGPFVSRATGEPYLQVHHAHTLAEGGEDTVYNAAALCPNCHMRCHHGADSQDAMDELYRRVSRLIRPFTGGTGTNE